MSDHHAPAFPTVVETGVVEHGDLEGNKIYRHVDPGMSKREHIVVTLSAGALAGKNILTPELVKEIIVMADYIVAECAK